MCVFVWVCAHTVVSYYVPGPVSPGPREWVVVVSLRDAAEVPGDEGREDRKLFYKVTGIQDE